MDVGITCRKDGQHMDVEKVQIVRPESEIRIWMKCPRCDGGMVMTFPYTEIPIIQDIPE
jgi:uncharacterized protein YbbK (DUF523 family)